MNQSQERETLTPSGLPPVPTTKILAMGHFVSPLTAEQRHTVGAREVPATGRLYLAGKIDQWWYRQDGRGVVFLINETSKEEARELLESLPFAQAKLMQFELLPLGPLAPLNALLRDLSTEQPDVVMAAPEKRKLAQAFIAAIRSCDRQMFESIMAEDVVWSLPGTSLVSGDALGVDRIMKRAESLAQHGVNIEIGHVVLGLSDIGLLLHNTGEHGGRKLDEHLTTILQLRGRKIHRLDTYISDVEMLNKYFA